jgi:hypothetical protein
VSEYGDALRELVAHLPTHDPGHRRFGAQQHQYRLRPPLARPRLEAIEGALDVRFPDDYRAHVLEADGGAGPYYGLMPLDHPAQLACALGTFDPDAPDDRFFDGTVGLAHLGCGYVSFLVVRGPQAGTVMLDARACGEGIIRLFDGFNAFFVDWVRAATHQELQRAYVPPGRCALPGVLTKYLADVEQKLGVPKGSASNAQIEAALAEIPDGAIKLSELGDTPFFAQGDRLDPCPICAHMATTLGMRMSQIQPGLPPIPLRS